MDLHRHTTQAAAIERSLEARASIQARHHRHHCHAARYLLPRMPRPGFERQHTATVAQDVISTFMDDV